MTDSARATRALFVSPRDMRTMHHGERRGITLVSLKLKGRDVAAPFGHGLVGMAIARRLGVRSRTGLAIAALAGNLPDADIPLGWLVHGDAWKMHRTWTHTAGFALTVGALAGLAGVVRAESVEGERDLVADTLMGAVIVGSHVVLDRIPYLPEVPVGPSVASLRLVNWVLDAIEWGAVAWLIWPKGGARGDGAGAVGPS